MFFRYENVVNAKGKAEIITSWWLPQISDWSTGGEIQGKKSQEKLT